MNSKEDFFTACDETNIPTTVLGFLQSKDTKRKSVTRCRAFDSPRETSIQKQFHTQVKDLNTEELRQLLCDVVSVNGELQDTLQQNNEQLEKQLKELQQWKNRKNEEKINLVTKKVSNIKKEDGKQPKNEVIDSQIHEDVNFQATPEDLVNQSNSSSTEARIEDLRNRLEDAEMRAQRTSDDLEQMTAQKMALERDVTELQNDIHRLKANEEAMVAEKWELSAANADLQNRMQTMAITYMQQGRPDDGGMLQEELRKMQMALADERKVTEKLSRNLELEKRRSESLDQKLKGTNRRSAGSMSSNNDRSHVPEEIRQRDDQLAISMENYRLHCENLGSNLEECEQKLEGFEIQEDYHVADLRKELSNVKKLLSDERRRSTSDGQKMTDTQVLFAQVLKDYNSAIENVKQLQQEKRSRNNEPESNSHNSQQVESLSAKLTQAQIEVKQEKAVSAQLNEKIKHYELEVERIPLLIAQVEVYQSDFNAERQAREKIAGEKADLVEEIRRLKNTQPNIAFQNNVETNERNNPHQREPMMVPTNAVRDAVNQFAANQDRLEEPVLRPKRDTAQTFNCPKCSKTFAVLRLLQNHVNDCLDRP